jgi:hypothetical protein
MITEPADHVPTDACLSDAELVRSVAADLSVPRADPADSFVLHAPLELLARATLLPLVTDDRRALARARIADLGDRFLASGPALEPGPAPRVDDFGSVAGAAAQLGAALRAGDLDAVDGAGWWLALNAEPTQLRAVLAGPVLTSLAAAAHAPIFLHLFPRAAASTRVGATPVRGLLREMGRHPTWQVSWIDDVPASGAEDPVELDRVLSEATDRGLGGSDFIQPTMDRVDSTRVAAERLGPVTGTATAEHARVLLRVAARSMLVDRSAAAPYGWTHCLTLPQAVTALADVVDPDRALRVAATEVLGFRAALGDRPVPATGFLPGGPDVPPDPGLPLEVALGSGPTEAAGAAWHSTVPPATVRAALASAASAHHDAHVVKYTLACLDAADTDPSHGRLHLAAAASLIGWWSQE